MSIREELTRQAERSLRLGRVDEAVAQYQDLADLAPVDWGLVKQLADLLERAGQREGAARQFARWADHLFIEGFHSKAAALYKKVLKLEPSDEHAIWQLGEVSLQLKLRADARLAFQRVAEIRQRRGDATGAAAARERLASVDGMPVVPTAALATPPAYAPVQAPAAAPILPPPASLLEAPTTEASIAGHVPTHARVGPAPGTAADRLARLRREAEDADARADRDADAAWQAVLDADPADVAVRLRLVQAATDRGDLEAASRLAVTLDASDDPALVALVDLAHQRGRPADVTRLIADRVHAGGLPAHVLGPVDALSARRPAAARAALAAAVGAWAAAGQPGRAVAALEQAEGRGLLTTPLYLQWVEICVDAGLPGLSRAQRALAGAYRAEHRLAEARAVAEDVFVRDAGAEPSRALLLDILDREGIDEPHRVLVDLLTPPSDSVEESDDERLPEFAPPATSCPAAADALPAADVPFKAPDVDVADQFLSPPMAEPYMSQPVAVPAARVPDARETDALFDWSDLLGRDLEQSPAPVTASSPVDASVADVAIAVPDPYVSVAPGDASLVASGPAESAAAEPEPGPEPEPESEPKPKPKPGPEPESEGDPVQTPAPDVPAVVERTSAPEPVREPPVVTAPDTSLVADASPLRIGDLRAQPLLADDAPLQPSFSMPEAWLTESPVPASADAPRRRAPADDFFFDDDATPPRWAPPAARAGGLSATSRAGQGAGVGRRDPEPWLDLQEGRVVVPSATEPDTGDSSAVDVDPVPPSPATAEEADMAPPGDGSPEPGELQQPAETLPVEEEVDLTQLLEELKQWDPVLPEPRVRQRGEQPSAVAPVEAAEDEAVADPAVDAQAAVFGSPAEARTLDQIPPAPSPDDVHAPRTAEFEAVFADMQRHTDDRVVAEQQLAAGRVFLAAGLVSEAARAFERASLEPRSRFAATLALAELHKSRSQMLDAVGWYEQAAMAPVPDAAVKRAVLYDLAESLEALGETDRALGVLLDLLSQVEDYRDARARLDRLLRVDAGG